MAEAIPAVEKEYDAGNYRGSACVAALFNEREAAGLNVVDRLSACYRFLDDDRAALAHGQRV
jgi:hypothetical protein